ncbi:hypothetical protein [Corynebacterium liangguodongii]|uniref:Uncharacterized protein n=1 Tax=Corynebacterium liangguodongii TaxID=2079535 RepID=A0A2S0WBI4_9CORY|nr:hypothetical protein [Corynebacterium liangguodongii]AWB83126.1 hypothetical protein C3E79_00330 [Corynebacterium liangguodongii]PWB99273.1 hypothetical protein DF219_06745 [Corynebacterium liangguodongii]
MARRAIAAGDVAAYDAKIRVCYSDTRTAPEYTRGVEEPSELPTRAGNADHGEASSLTRIRAEPVGLR